MRYGVLSDIHANLHALSAGLSALAADNVDEYLCTGDIVGYGPRPDECAALLATVGARCVAGNHDLMAIGALQEARAGVLARQALHWTRAAMSATTRAFLEALPRTLTTSGVLLAHGSPTDPEEYVRDPARAQQIIADAPEDVSVVLLGHTHHQWAVSSGDGELLRRRTGGVRLRPGQGYLLNSGSIGQSRDGDGLARFLVLDTAQGWAEFRSVEYDVEASSADLRDAGLPVRSLHATDRSSRELVLGAQRRWATWRADTRPRGRHADARIDAPRIGG